VIVFPSHKYHTVVPVLSGRRRTLILEFWCGEERICPHRCEQHWGVCNYNILHLPTTAANNTSTQPGQLADTSSSADVEEEEEEAAKSRTLHESWPRFHQRVLSARPLSLALPGVEQLPLLRVAPLPPPMPQPDPLADGLDALLLSHPVLPAHRAQFARDGYIRLKRVIPDTVLAAARAELISIVLPAMADGVNASDPDPETKAALRRHNTGVGGANGVVRGSEAEALWEAVSAKAQPWHVQYGWKLRACLHQLVLAPRVAQILRDLLGLDATNGNGGSQSGATAKSSAAAEGGGGAGGGGGGVRLYQEDAVSRPPGSGRTAWQRGHSDGPMAFDTQRYKAATVWIPLQQTTPEMGAVSYSSSQPPSSTSDSQPEPADLQAASREGEGQAGTSTGNSAPDDDAAAAAAAGSSLGPHSCTYELGDISVRLEGGGSDGGGLWYCHPPNHTTASRMSLECTYFVDGAVCVLCPNSALLCAALLLRCLAALLCPCPSGGDLACPACLTQIPSPTSASVVLRVCAMMSYGRAYLSALTIQSLAWLDVSECLRTRRQSQHTSVVASRRLRQAYNQAVRLNTSLACRTSIKMLSLPRQVQKADQAMNSCARYYLASSLVSTKDEQLVGLMRFVERTGLLATDRNPLLPACA
jgi:hypothetical protein